MVEKYGADGVMIGRASIGHPFIFREIKHFIATGTHHAPPTLQERLDASRTHLLKSVEWKGEKVGIFEMRRHYAPYFAGLPNIKPFRSRLVVAPTVAEILDIINEIEIYYGKEENLVLASAPVPVYLGYDA